MSETITETTIPKDVPLKKERRWPKGDFWQLVGEADIAIWRTEEFGREKIEEICRVGDEVVIKAQAYDDEWVKVDIDEEEVISYLEPKKSWSNQLKGEVKRIFEYVQRNPEEIYIYPERNYLLEIKIETSLATLTTRRFLRDDEFMYKTPKGVKYLSLHFPRTKMKF